MRRARREAAWREKGPTKEQREAFQAGTLPSGENDAAPESLGSGLAKSLGSGLAESLGSGPVETENARSFSAEDGAGSEVMSPGEASDVEASAKAGDSAASVQISDIWG